MSRQIRRTIWLTAIAAMVSLCLGQPAWAAVAVNSTTSGSGTTTTLTISHTPAGSNRLLLVGIAQAEKDNTNIVSVVFNGTETLTLVGGAAYGVAKDASAYIYKLVNPTATTANVVITFSAAPLAAAAGVVSFTGVDQAAPLGTIVAEQDNSVTVSSATGELVFDTAAAKDQNITVGAGQTGLWDITGGIDCGGSTKAGATSVTMSWTGATTEYAMAAVPVKPASANSAPSAPTIDNYNTGAWGNDNTPTLQFDLTDPDSGDIVKYQIQIDDTSNFSSTVVDFTEASGSAVPRNDVTYTPAALGDGSYYWRVRGIDDDAATGSWATANGGSVAFGVDTVAPTGQSISSITVNSTTQLTVNAATGSDATSGLNTTPYWFNETTGGAGASDSVAWQASTAFADSGLSAHTQYTYQVKIRDAAGNETAYSSTSSATTPGTAPSISSITRLFDNEKTADTTPGFTFIATDPDADNVDFEIRWDTDYNFGTATTKASSNYPTDAGWTAATFSSGSSVTYTVQAGNALTNGVTYWWQARSRDPSDTNTWSSWSTARSFTIDTSVTVPMWHQTTQEQFDTDTLTGTAQTQATDDVRMSGQ